MLQKRSQRTLKEEVELISSPMTESRKYRKWSKILIFLLLVLVVSLFPGYIIYIEGSIFLLSLFQYLMKAKQQNRKKSELQKSYGNKVRMLPWALLAIYFASFALVFTGYGCIRYVFQYPAMDFDFLLWLKHSISVLLLFEIIALQINRKRG